MGRGSAVTDEELGEIKARVEHGESIPEIARNFKRSRDLVTNTINRGLDNHAGVSTGRPRALNPRTVRNIRRHGSNEVTFSAKIRRELNLDVFDRTVRCALEDSGYLAYEKKQSKPHLTADKVERRAFALAHVHWTNEWRQVVFSDEKKFNLDGPDGLAYYWHDLREEEEIFSTRQHGGGSVMFWFAINYHHSSEAGVIIEGNLNGNKYKQLLQRHLLPLCQYIEEESEEDVGFQHDNAKPHTAHVTQDWLDTQEMAVMRWPSHSPDLNPIENVFGLLARLVYAENRQFATVHDLEEAVIAAWDQLPYERIYEVINSMGARMVQIVEAHGGYTKY